MYTLSLSLNKKLLLVTPQAAVIVDLLSKWEHNGAGKLPTYLNHPKVANSSTHYAVTRVDVLHVKTHF